MTTHTISRYAQLIEALCEDFMNNADIKDGAVFEAVKALRKNWAFKLLAGGDAPPSESVVQLRSAHLNVLCDPVPASRGDRVQQATAIRLGFAAALDVHDKDSAVEIVLESYTEKIEQALTSPTPSLSDMVIDYRLSDTTHLRLIPLLVRHKPTTRTTHYTVEWRVLDAKGGALMWESNSTHAMLRELRRAISAAED